MAESRAQAKDVHVSLGGMLTVVGDLVVPRAKAEDRDGGENRRPQSCCPIDAAEKIAVPVNTVYVCPNHPGRTFRAAEVAKAAKVDDELRLIGSADDLRAARAMDEDKKKSLELRPHLASEVAHHTIMGSTSYVFRPSRKSDLHGVLSTIVGQDGRVACDDGQDRVLLGTVVLSGVSKLMLLRCWGDELLLQQLEFPSNLKSFEPIARSVDDRNIALARSFVQATSVSFSADLYTSDSAAQVGKFIADRLANPDGVSLAAPPADTPGSSSGDLMAALEASIAAATAKSQASIAAATAKAQASIVAATAKAAPAKRARKARPSTTKKVA